jgi:hypothetical protein
VRKFIKTKTRTAAVPINPKKLKRLPRGAFLAGPGATEGKNTKVRISILVDLDVLKLLQTKGREAW